MAQGTVDILVATYNGARYLSQQLDSLLAQTEAATRILIGDDGSIDDTLAIISRYETQYPDGIKRLPPGPAQGASANFNYLLAATEANYVFLADQDDVWDQDKLAVSLSEMMLLEAEFGSATPILVHTDLRVVDQALGLISPSFFRLQRLEKNRHALKDLLCQSVVTGCTVVVNRALIKKALPISRNTVMHDWWLSLVAAAFGKVGFVDRATMSYRQHGANTIGAKPWSVGFLTDKLKKLWNARTAAELLRPGLVQAKAFFMAYGTQLSPQQFAEVSGYARLMDLSPLQRIGIALKHRFRKQGVLRTLGFYWALLVADFHD